MRVPSEAGEGIARVTLKFPALKELGVRDRVIEIPVAPLEPGEGTNGASASAKTREK